MGAYSKNQGRNMCCQHKRYDIIEKENLNALGDLLEKTKREVL